MIFNQNIVINVNVDPKYSIYSKTYFGESLNIFHNIPIRRNLFINSYDAYILFRIVLLHILFGFFPTFPTFFLHFSYISDINNSTRVTLSIYRNWNLFSVRSDIREYLPNSRVMSASISVDGIPIYSLGQYRVQALFLPRMVSNMFSRKNRA